MRALTIRQPWATLLVRGEKRWEGRSWRPAAKHVRTRIAIHAGRHDSAMNIRRIMGGPGPELARSTLPVHALIAMATLAEVQPMPLGSEASYIDTDARWAWALRDVYELPEPISCPGRLGLWELPGSVRARLNDSLQSMRTWPGIYSLRDFRMHRLIDLTAIIT